MKQWVEPESTKPWKETFGNQSESKLTTRDVGLDKEETEEVLILTSLGVHSKSTQPLECIGVRGLLANFLPRRLSPWIWRVSHWPLDKLSRGAHLDHKLDRVCCRSDVGVPGGLSATTLLELQ